MIALSVVRENAVHWLKFQDCAPQKRFLEYKWGAIDSRNEMIAITLVQSFKITDFGTNRKPIYDFLSHLILHSFRDMADYWSNSR